MAIRTALWTVGGAPSPLANDSLASERDLEDMIVAAPEILSDQWMIIGRQEATGAGGRIDLLAIAPDGTLILVEIKRDRTPREVVAQAIDYASWVESLKPEDIVGIYGRFAPGSSLGEAFRSRFGQDLDEETLNQAHQIVIVSAALDHSSERIVNYLAERDIAINVLCFQVFRVGTEQLLSRSWLRDPLQSQVTAAVQPDRLHEPWNGEFYASFGHGEARSWDEAVEYGFICAGGGAWYSRTLQLLSPNDRVWVLAPGHGYVGVGLVTGSAQPASTFSVPTEDGEVPVLDVLSGGTYHRQFVDDPERCEYFVPIRWIRTVPLADAYREIGLFGNQNTVCRPTAQKWRDTVARLMARFEV